MLVKPLRGRTAQRFLIYGGYELVLAPLVVTRALLTLTPVRSYFLAEVCMKPNHSIA